MLPATNVSTQSDCGYARPREILAAFRQLRSRAQEVSAADLDRLLSQNNIRLITLRMSRSHSVWDTGTPSTGLFASGSRPLLFSLRNTNSPPGHWRTLSLLRITDAAPALVCPRSGLGFGRRTCSFRKSPGKLAAKRLSGTSRWLVYFPLSARPCRKR